MKGEETHRASSALETKGLATATHTSTIPTKYKGRGWFRRTGRAGDAYVALTKLYFDEKSNKTKLRLGYCELRAKLYP